MTLTDIRRKKILHSLSSFLIAGGFLTLGYCAIVRVAAHHYQAQAGERLQKTASQTSVLSLSSPSRMSYGNLTGNEIKLVGRIEIPKIHLSAVVAEGATAEVLQLAVGHIPGTVMPWQTGNVGLAAHRDTFFRRLGELRNGDTIRLTVPGVEYKYRVTFVDIVKPTETWVLEPASDSTLTLITCYPFHYIGSAPMRFVVRSHRTLE